MQEINVSELLVDKFKNNNLNFIFGILSSGFMELGDILYDTDIKYIGTRHEQWAGHIADVVGRLTGKPQILLLPGGPGVTNSITAITVASINHSPMFVLSDGSTSITSGKNDFQDIDGTIITGHITKRSVTINRPDRVNEYFSMLYNLAQTPLLGPVHMEIPRDILLMKTSYDTEVKNQVIIYNSYPSVETVKSVLNIISNAKKPVLLLGEEINNPEGKKYLEEFIEKLHIPACSTHGNNDVLNNSSKYMMGAIGRLGSKRAMETISMADMVLVLGSSMNPYTFSPYYGFNYNALTSNIVQITMDSVNAGRNFTTFETIICNPVQFIKLAIQIIDSQEFNLNTGGYSNWFESIDNVEPDIFRGAYNSKVFEILFRKIPVKSNISLDAGSMSMVMLKWKKFGIHGRLLTSGNMGEVGFSISSSIGANLAIPDTPSYAFMGDGSFTMQMSALITAIEYDVPVKIIIFDNSAWGSEKAYQIAMYNNRFFGSNLKNPDIVRVVRSLGAIGIEANDISTLEHDIDDLNSSDRPAVLVIKMENDFPTPVRSLDAVKRVYRGLYKEHNS